VSASPSEPMKSCMRQHCHADSSRSKSVKISSPIRWRSKDRSKLDGKQQFVENLTLPQIEAILGELKLSIDGDSTYDKCVQRVVQSQWTPSRNAIQRYQRQRAKPVRTASQKQEDRVRLCKVDTVSNLSCAEMKLWLQRNGGRVPDGSSDADRKNMERAICNQMRVITPVVKRKRAPKRPKKAKSAGHIQRAPHWNQRISKLNTPPLRRPMSEQKHRDAISPEISPDQTPLESPVRSGRRTPLQPLSSSKKRRLRRKRDRQFFNYDGPSQSARTDQQKTTAKQPKKEKNVGFMQRLSLSSPPRNRRGSARLNESPSHNLFETPVRPGTSRSRQNSNTKQTLLFETPLETPTTDTDEQTPTYPSTDDRLAETSDVENLENEPDGSFLTSLVDLIDV